MILIGFLRVILKLKRFILKIFHLCIKLNLVLERRDISPEALEVIIPEVLEANTQLVGRRVGRGQEAQTGIFRDVSDLIRFFS